MDGIVQGAMSVGRQGMTNWISIKDELPKEHQDVQVMLKYKDCTDNCRGYAHYCDGFFWVSTALICSAHHLTSKYNMVNQKRLNKQVIYWTPLPKPPKD